MPTSQNGYRHSNNSLTNLGGLAVERLTFVAMRGDLIKVFSDKIIIIENNCQWIYPA